MQSWEEEEEEEGKMCGITEMRMSWEKRRREIH